VEYDYLLSTVPDSDLGGIPYSEKFSAESRCKALTFGHEKMMDEEFEDAMTCLLYLLNGSRLRKICNIRAYVSFVCRREIIQTPLDLVPERSGLIDDTKRDETSGITFCSLLESEYFPA